VTREEKVEVVKLLPLWLLFDWFLAACSAAVSSFIAGCVGASNRIGIFTMYFVAALVFALLALRSVRVAILRVKGRTPARGFSVIGQASSGDGD